MNDFAKENASNVKRRRVFYIPGYDPIPPRRYRELYRKEGREQAEISGFSLSQTPKTGDRFGWSVEGQFEEAQTYVEIDVLEWADIVQSSMKAGILRTYLILISTAWIYIRSGTLRDLMKLRRGPIIAALYPVAMLLGQLVLAVALFLSLLWAFSLFPPPMTGLGYIIAPIAFCLLLRWFKKVDNKIFAYYLMHDYGFSARWRGAEPPVLRPRIAEFQRDIAQALRQDWDEVLVVGHSSGAHLGVQILAQLLREEPELQSSGTLSFMSLGQVIPMVSFLPDAQKLRQDLQYLSAHVGLYWVDISAPGDPCSFSLCDPIACTGVACTESFQPKIISAAFTQTLSKKKQNEIKQRFFRLHFQYLCAFDRPDIFDYFSITAGPLTLRDRFMNVPESPSVIKVNANRHTSISRANDR